MTNKLLLAICLMLIPAACGNSKAVKEPFGVYCVDINGQATLYMDDVKSARLYPLDKYIKVVTKKNQQVVHFLVPGETCMLGKPNPPLPEPNKFRSKVYLENNN